MSAGLDLRLVGAEVLWPEGLGARPLRLAGGVIEADAPGREVDLSGFWVLPGIVDIHGDGFERHLAPRRGAMKNVDQGLVVAEAELAANGITTAVMAQFYSWEGGMRGPEFAERVFAGIAALRGSVATDLRHQLRFEIAMLAQYPALEDFVARHGVEYLVFNDHLPHEELAKGKRPPRLTGQALRIGRNPEKHLADMQAMHAAMGEVAEALDGLCARLRERGLRLGSHDDRSAEDRAIWRRRGVTIAEFPETMAAVEAAAEAGEPVIMGAPNLVRGGSHKGNVSAMEMVAMGHVGALASDYHYPSLMRAVHLIERGGLASLSAAWAMISEGPARMLGLLDRGRIAPGLRADLVVVDPETRRIGATIAGGSVSYMSGEVAARFIADAAL